MNLLDNPEGLKAVLANIERQQTMAVSVVHIEIAGGLIEITDRLPVGGDRWLPTPAKNRKAFILNGAINLAVTKNMGHSPSCLVAFWADEIAALPLIFTPLQMPHYVAFGIGMTLHLENITFVDAENKQ